MISTSRLLLTAIVLVSVSTGALRAQESGTKLPKQDDLGVLVDTLRTSRRAFLEVNLQLKPDEAAKFWPLYDRYQQEISAIGDRILAVVQDYSANFRTLSDEK